MYLHTSIFTNPTDKYRAKITELRAKTIFNYIEIFKALLQCYLDTNAAYVSSSHNEYCIGLINKINNENLTIIQILHNVNEYIASRKQANQYEMTSDFQIMVDIFLKEYKMPAIIPYTPLQEKYVKIIQDYNIYDSSEVKSAFEYLAEIELETDVKHHMLKQLILPILHDEDRPDIRMEIFAYILLKFLPLNNDLLQELMPIYKNKIGESGIGGYLKYVNIPKLFPENVEFQKIMIDYCNTFSRSVDVARLILQLLPFINDNALKKNAIHCLVTSLGSDRSNVIHITANTLVDLLSSNDNDIRNYIVKMLEHIFHIHNDNEARDIFFKNPLYIRLGCAYFRAKGKSEDEINTLLIEQPLLRYPSTLADCVIGILTGYKNFANPLNGAQSVMQMLESRLKFNNIFSEEDQKQIFQLIEQNVKIDKYPKKEIVDILKKNVVSDEGSYKDLSLRALIIISKNDITFQSKIHQFLLDLPDSMLNYIVLNNSTIQLQDRLPAEILITNDRTFNLVFDCLLPLLKINQSEVLASYTNEKIVYYMKNLSIAQLEALAKKIQTLYKEDKRSDYCQILLSNIERRLLINFARSTESNEYMSLLPIELRENQVIPRL